MINFMASKSIFVNFFKINCAGIFSLSYASFPSNQSLRLKRLFVAYLTLQQNKLERLYVTYSSTLVQSL